MPCLDPSFASCLEDHDLDELERYAGTVYALRPDFRLAYINPAWFRFAEDNGGEPDISCRWPLGAPIMPAISAALRSFYEIKFRTCLERGEPWVHDYECSSAGVYRRFCQTTYPLKGGCGLLIMNSLAIETVHQPEDRSPKPAAKKKYRDDSGAIGQCAHCRRVMDPAGLDRWDWVPAWVGRPPDEVAFGLCADCRQRYAVEAP